MSDLVTRPAAQPLVADAEVSVYRESQVDLAPLSERVKIWAACGLFCAVVGGGLFKVFLL
jgi:hypothetical protein